MVCYTLCFARDFARTKSLTVVCMNSVFSGRAVRYWIVIEGFDWGPSVSHIIIDGGKKALSSELRPEGFSVYATQKDIPPKKGRNSGLNLRFPGSVVEEEPPADTNAFRKVLAAYRAGRDGCADGTGRYIELELENGPTVPASSFLRYDKSVMRNISVRLEHTITLPDGRICRPKDCVGVRYAIADEFDMRGKFRFVDSQYGTVSLRYAFWSPAKKYPRKENQNSGYPLIIWLHGAGESGTDPLVALFGNRVTNLASDAIQASFGGAYVLVPQCPTMWMDDGSGGYSLDGNQKYSRALKGLIDRFIRAHPDIDTDRVYIGGCSNGGFMAVRLVVDTPAFFAAAFPACEGFDDAWLTEKTLRALADTPLRLVHSKADATVPCARYTERLFSRLVAAGAADISLYLPDSIIDKSGRYFGADGSPYAYNGHFSWVYVLDDACEFSDGKPLMKWMAGCRRK